MPFDKYIEESYLENSIPKVLKEKGFRVDLLPTFTVRTILKSDEIASNLVKKSPSSNNYEVLSKSLHLIDISIYRSVPQILTMYVQYQFRWLFLQLFPHKKLTHFNAMTRDENFYGDISKIDDSYTEPVFKFYHLTGCHAPYNRNAEGKKVVSESTRQVYSGFVIYNLKRLVSFLDKLKSKGIYNKSLIYIIGDHGAGRSKGLAIKTNLIDNNDYIDRNTIPYRIKARAAPLMMIKNFFSTDEFKIVSKPLSLADIPQMIFKDLDVNLDISSEGWSNGSNNTQYTRKHFNKESNTDLMYEYSINGHAWLDSSWTGPIRVHTKKGLYEKVFSVIFEEDDPENYKIEPPGPLDGYEFKSVELEGTAENRRNSYAITIKRENQDSDYFLSIQKNDEVKKLIISVYVDDKRVGRFKSNKPLIGMHIPKTNLQNEDVEILISLEGGYSKIIENMIVALYLFKQQSN